MTLPEPLSDEAIQTFFAQHGAQRVALKSGEELTIEDLFRLFRARMDMETRDAWNATTMPD